MVAKAATFGVSSAGSVTPFDSTPASPGCWVTVTRSDGFFLNTVVPFDPTEIANVGLNGSVSQPVGV
jgi:hypothetical protein